MFLKVLSILYLSSYYLDIGVCSDRGYQRSDTDLHVKKDDFDIFKSIVFEEIQDMKQEGHKLKDDITRLKTENAEKDVRIKELEQKLASVQKEEGKGMTRRRIPYYETIGFTAYLDHGVHNLTHDQPVIFNKALLNDGNVYDVSTGMFTAPVSGVYLFSYSVGAKLLPNVHLKQYDVFTRLIVSGVHQLSAVAESTNTYDDEQGSTTAIVYVDEGSQVWVKHEIKGGNNLFSEPDERVTSFTGTLLYEKENESSSIIG